MYHQWWANVEYAQHHQILVFLSIVQKLLALVILRCSLVGEHTTNYPVSYAQEQSWCWLGFWEGEGWWAPPSPRPSYRPLGRWFCMYTENWVNGTGGKFTNNRVKNCWHRHKCLFIVRHSWKQLVIGQMSRKVRIYLAPLQPWKEMYSIKKCVHVQQPLEI